MSYTITQAAWTVLYNLRAQLQLVASLASHSNAHDMQELSVFLEVMAADAKSVLTEAEATTHGAALADVHLPASTSVIGAGWVPGVPDAHSPAGPPRRASRRAPTAASPSSAPPADPQPAFQRISPRTRKGATV